MEFRSGLVSIITPVYNSEPFLRDCIDSVLSQSYMNWELILIDDNSADNSWKICQNASRFDNRIIAFRNDVNLGAGSTRNRGIDYARGEFIAFLDSDDLWQKEKLRIQIGLMNEHKAVLSHTSYEYMSEYGVCTGNMLKVSQKAVSYRDLLKRTEIGCLTAVYSQARLGKIFMSSRRNMQDYELWLSILNKGHSSLPIDFVLAKYRVRTGSVSSNKTSLVSKHFTFLVETQKMSNLRALYYTLWWGLNGLKRHWINMNIAKIKRFIDKTF